MKKWNGRKPIEGLLVLAAASTKTMLPLYIRGAIDKNHTTVLC